MSFDTGFLPSDDEPRSVDEVLTDLDAALARDPDSPAFDEGDAADLVLAAEEPPPLGKSWAFDFEAGRFVGAPGAPLATHGLATLRTWIEKCLRTPQGAFPVHPPDYGVEGLLDIIGEPLADGVGVGLETKIHEALTFHPRIADVGEFTYTLDVDGEALMVSFTVWTGAGTAVRFDNFILGV
jgi:phage baseplate assembly protein W